MNSKSFFAVAALSILASFLIAEEPTAKKVMSPIEVAMEYKAQLAVLNFDGLRALMTKSEYSDEFKEEEQELNAAKKLGEAVYNARLQKEKAEAKRDSDEMRIISETVNGNRAIVTYEETDDNEVNYMFLIKKGDGPWLISETDEDDLIDAERFIKVKLHKEK